MSSTLLFLNVVSNNSLSFLVIIRFISIQVKMGGIQAKAGSVAEVHAVRGGQLILRVAPSQTTTHIMEARREAKRKSSRRGKLGSGFASLGGSFEGEGNDLIMFKEASISISNLAKSNKYNGRCYLLDQSMDILEKIFVRLSPRDLALLCLTSKAVNNLVREFIDHHSSSHGLPVKFLSFYKLNENLLLPKEEVLKDRIEANQKPQLLLYSTMKYFIGKTSRISILNIDEKLAACNNTGSPCIIKGTDQFNFTSSWLQMKLHNNHQKNSKISFDFFHQNGMFPSNAM